MCRPTRPPKPSAGRSPSGHFARFPLPTRTAGVPSVNRPSPEGEVMGDCVEKHARRTASACPNNPTLHWRWRLGGGIRRAFQIPVKPGNNRPHELASNVKRRHAAIRDLFDWLITGPVVLVNPAGSVRRTPPLLSQNRELLFNLGDHRGPTASLFLLSHCDRLNVSSTMRTSRFLKRNIGIGHPA